MRLFGRRHNRRGITIIEVTTTVGIILIVGVLSTGVIVGVAQLGLGLPAKIRNESIAGEITRTIADGMPGVGGVRSARRIVTAEPVRLEYVTGYPLARSEQRVAVRLDAATHAICIAATAVGDAGGTLQNEKKIPSYFGGAAIEGDDTTPVFRYYRSAGAGGEQSQMATSVDPAQVSRIEVIVRVKSGYPPFACTGQSSVSVDVRRYQ